MAYEIRKAAVLGAGVMGASIAAHFANAGIKCALLDIVPSAPPDEERRKRDRDDASAWRSSLAASALNKLLTSKPAAFYTRRNASLIKTGNFEDHLDWLQEADWVVEAVVEDLKIKQELFARIEKYLKSECIVSTNTSGLPVREISARFRPALKENFLGTHFFNPPRYMKLLEIIPLPETRQELVEYLAAFCEDALGKGVIICRDIPGFVANRIGAYDMATAIRLTVEKNFSVEETDAVIGRALGRAGSSLFGTLDIVGLDVARHVMQNLYESLSGDESRNVFVPPDFIDRMVEKNWLGNKTKGGFYRKRRDENGKNVKMVLDYRCMEYVALTVPRFDSLSRAKKDHEDTADKIKALFNGSDAAAQLAREYLCRNFIYAANRVPEICDDIVSVDRAMRWGYNHEMGPFETWDAVGVRSAVAAMEKLNLTVPAKVREMLNAGHESFYVKDGVKEGNGILAYDFEKKDYVRIHRHPRVIVLPSRKEREKIIRQSAGAGLVDLEDGVACFQIHTKMNAIDDDVIRMLFESADIVEKDFLGMVIGNNDANFSAGANILKVLMACQQGEWDLLEQMVAAFQKVNMRLKYMARPVIAAPAGLTLGGGCEIAMHAAQCQPCGETYMGLVETAVGVIPAGGGCKELMLRLTEGIPDGLVEAGLNLQHFYAKAFETIAAAKVATSAAEAMDLGYIRRTEHVSINRDLQLWDAKQVVIGLAGFYRKPKPALIPVMGENFRGLAEAFLYTMRQGDYVSDYDVSVARKLASVLSGGDCPEGTLIGEQEILDREREAFLSLCGEQKTQDRIMHMLKTGKPLRN
jgi:3-hydroxyacyl-CoA dehydrogenase